VILLDTSILVTYLRTRSPALKLQFATGQMTICPVNRAEILHGAKDDTDRTRLLRFLDQFPMLPVADKAWDELGLNLSRLRRAGVPVPFPDALIATLAAMSDLPVWSFDTHYALMQPHIPGLQLFTASVA